VASDAGNGPSGRWINNIRLTGVRKRYAVGTTMRSDLVHRRQMADDLLTRATLGRDTLDGSGEAMSPVGRMGADAFIRFGSQIYNFKFPPGH